MTQETPTESEKNRICAQHYKTEKRIWKTAGAVILASVLTAMGSCGKSIHDYGANPYKNTPQVAYCNGLQRAVKNLEMAEHTVVGGTFGDSIIPIVDSETAKILQQEKQGLSNARKELSDRLAVAEKDPTYISYNEVTRKSDFLGHLGLGMFIGGVILGIAGGFYAENLNDKIETYRLRKVTHNNLAAK